MAATLRSWQFQLSTQVVFGRGGLRRLATLARPLGQRAALIGYRECSALEEAYARAGQALRQAGFEVFECLEIDPEPELAAVERCAQRLAATEIDFVVALGGGSVIDAGKAVALLAGEGEAVGLFEHVDTNPRRRPAERALPLVALPTTAGTGAEVTSVAVLSHHANDELDRREDGGADSHRPWETPRGEGTPPREGNAGSPHPSPFPEGEGSDVRSPHSQGAGSDVRAPLPPRAANRTAASAKLSITAACLRPRIALIDPELSTRVAPELAAEFAVDALAHAIEAQLSRASNPISAVLAARAIALIFTHMPDLRQKPDAAEARDGLALAAALAGMALNESGVTMAHSVAHAIGAELGLPHRRAVALATPLGLHFNRVACEPTYAELATACGLIGDCESARAAAFLGGVETLLAAAGLADKPRLPAAEIEALAGQLAGAAFAHTPTPLRLNPVRVDEAALSAALAAWLRLA